MKPPRHPVIDAHNHLWAVNTPQELAAIADVLDEAGVAGFCDLTGNAMITFEAGGYALRPRDFGALDGGKRFYAFTMAEFARPTDRPLFDDACRFADECVETLRDHVDKGARGLKVLKELGLVHRDAAGDLVRIDDQRLTPIWRECGVLGIPVLMHQADPSGFFEPITPDNEHYDTMKKYPAWSFADAKYPRKAQLLARRDRMIEANPETTFILPHVANQAEGLAAVDALLRRSANVMIDMSARCDELGRRRDEARQFFSDHSERILFGTDMPPSVDVYRFHYRFLETGDGELISPDYDGTFGRYRWKVRGLALADDILRNLYYRNACRTIPGLAEQLSHVLPPDSQPGAPAC